jgi:Calcineurin-like phosphoesterase
VTTLVLSDLHLGMRSGRDLLRRAPVRARLLERLDGANRVVLLGDAVELRHGPMAGALQAARPVFEDLGAALGPDGEIVVVPGNHDHRLLAGWHERRRAAARGLRLEHRIAPRAGEPAALLARWAAPARLTLAYPGLWLRQDVYATHGHWLDRHLTLPTLERLAIGALGRLTGPPPQRARPDDYEAALAPLYALAHELAQRARSGPGPGGAPGARRARPPGVRTLLAVGRGDRPPRLAALGRTLPPAVAALNALGLGPLRADVAVEDLCPAALAAMREVCGRLRLDAPHVVFGHMHRAGPWPADDPAAWTAPPAMRLVCTGSWVHEPALGAAYAPGTAVRVDGAGAPRLVALLDDLADFEADARRTALLTVDTGSREVLP